MANPEAFFKNSFPDRPYPSSFQFGLVSMHMNYYDRNKLWIGTITLDIPEEFDGSWKLFHNSGIDVKATVLRGANIKGYIGYSRYQFSINMLADDWTNLAVSEKLAAE